MKICFFSKLIGLSGKHLFSRLSLVEQFARLGHKVYVVGLYNDKIRGFGMKNVKFYTIPEHRDESIFGKLNYLIKFRKILKNLVGKEGIDAMIAINRTEHFIMSTIGGNFVKIIDYNDPNFERFSGLKKILFDMAERFSINNCDFVVSVLGAGITKYINESYPNKEHHVIINGYDKRFFDQKKYSRKKLDSIRKSLGILGMDLMVIYTGYIGGGGRSVLGKIYRMDLLLDAAKKIVDTNSNIKFVIAGHGDYFENMKRFIKSNSLEKNVIYIGDKTIDDIAGYVAAADFCVIPMNQDGSLKLNEYVGMCKPIVATRDDVNHGEFGEKLTQNNIILTELDSDNLAEGILKMADNPELRREITKNLERISVGNDWESLAKRYLEIIGKHLDEKS